MMPARYLVAVALLIAANCAAFAADPVFPPGARVGMTPLVGLGKARSFIGFETEDQGVKVLVTDLPAEAYGEVANAFKNNPGGTGGIKPESIETGAGLAYYTVENAKDGATNVRRYSMILPSRTPGMVVAICWAKRPRSSGEAAVDPMMPMIMKGAISKPAFSSLSDRMIAAPGASVRTFLNSLSSFILNGSIPSCSSTGTSLRIFAEANIWRMASSV